MKKQEPNTIGSSSVVVGVWKWGGNVVIYTGEIKKQDPNTIGSSSVVVGVWGGGGNDMG